MEYNISNTYGINENTNNQKIESNPNQFEEYAAKQISKKNMDCYNENYQEFWDSDFWKGRKLYQNSYNFKPIVDSKLNSNLELKQELLIKYEPSSPKKINEQTVKILDNTLDGTLDIKYPIFEQPPITNIITNYFKPFLNIFSVLVILIILILLLCNYINKKL